MRRQGRRAHGREVGRESQLDSGGIVPLEEVADGFHRRRDDTPVRDPLAFGVVPWREGRRFEPVFVQAAGSDGIEPGERCDTDTP